MSDFPKKMYVWDDFEHEARVQTVLGMYENQYIVKSGKTYLTHLNARELYALNVTMKEIAEKFGVDKIIIIE
jgi:hypothetical protein